VREREQGNTRREKVATMAETGKLVAPAIMLVMVLSVVAAVGAARPLAGEEWAGEGTVAGESVTRLLGQRLSGPGYSCETWNPDGGCR
jgi:hypothetical protein